MYNCIIFDFDGTLANTIEDLANAVNYSLKKHSLPTYPVEDYKHFVGSGVINLIRRTLGDQSNDDALVAEIKSDFDIYYGKHSMDKTYVYAGITNMLKELNAQGIQLAVLSNKPHPFMISLMDKLFKGINFSAVWGKKEQYPIKPNPQSLYGIMEEIGAAKHQVIYVGDSDTDVQTAVNAGVAFAGASWGFRGEQELLNAGAAHTFDDAEGLLRFILNS